MNLKKLLGLQSPKEKIQEFKELKKQLQNIDNSGKELSEQFMIQKSVVDNIDDLPETFKIERMELFEKFIAEHKKKVVKLYNERCRIMKSIEEYKNDEEIADACKDIELLEKSKEAYEAGKIDKKAYFDIIKSVTGEPVKYADVVAMTEGGELLILHRVDDDFTPNGTVCIPGGHVDPGEDFETAAMRKLKEETNLDPIKERGIVELGEYKSEDAHIKYYQVWVDKKQPVTVDASEHCFHEFINISEIPFKPFIYEQGKNVMNLLNNIHGFDEVRPLMKALEDGRITEEIFMKACDKIVKKAMDTCTEKPLMKESMEGSKKKAVFVVRDPKQEIKSIMDIANGCNKINMYDTDVEFKNTLCIHDCIYKSDSSNSQLVEMEVVFTGNEEDMIKFLQHISFGFISGKQFDIRTPHEKFMSVNENGIDYVGEPVFVSL